MTGKTKAAGYEIGLRKTFPVDSVAVWALLMSADAVALWLGRASDLTIEEGKTYRLENGATGEFRVVRPGSHVRLAYKTADAEAASTIQLRVIAKENGKATVSFHQEKLDSAEARAHAAEHWSRVMKQLENLLAAQA
ncbi:SRPBCC domain-containing protein [Oscillospiraceae bacterium CM]|nr:SRPBCC domain-containing protein [Oscillospiraceae bacterium CM]